MTPETSSEFILPYRIDGKEFLPFLARLNEVGVAQEIAIDFAGLRRVSPASLTALVAIVVRWRRERRRVYFRNVEKCAIKGYLQRMDALKLCGVELSEDFCRHDPKGRFVPVRLIDHHVDQMGGEMASCIAPGGEDFGHRMASLYDFASYVVTETANNARQHSGGLGYASAQVVRTEGMVRIAIADNGGGILKSFQDAGFSWSHGLDDVGGIIKALEPKISSKGTPMNEGVGLTLVSELARLTNAWMLVISGAGVVRMSGGGKPVCNTLPRGTYYKGTLVALVFAQTNVKNYAELLHEAKIHAGLLQTGASRVRFEA